MMNTIDFTPLYRNSIGFDRLESLLSNALRSESPHNTYPAYDIEMLEDDHYAISLAVAGFELEELDINVEKGVLTVSGEKSDNNDRKFIYHGIANRTFERKFNLADHVEVSGAELKNGLLTVKLVKELPEAMKPRKIAINQDSDLIEHKAKQDKAA
jgi:molecular chaperone IbpA